jgi:uncharacterized cupredoxin-like copper-binding protein
MSCSRMPTERTVEIDINHSRFSPAELKVGRGETMKFVIKNLDPIDHEFILGDEAVQLRHENGTDPHHGAVPGEVSIPVGGVGETTYTFNGLGQLLFACHLPGHYRYGMKGNVRVR